MLWIFNYAEPVGTWCFDLRLLVPCLLVVFGLVIHGMLIDFLGLVLVDLSCLLVVWFDLDLLLVDLIWIVCCSCLCADTWVCVFVICDYSRLLG